MDNWVTVYITILALLIRTTTGIFSTHFQQFILHSFGSRVLQELERSDLGLLGSFGGCMNDCENLKVNHRPIIFIHGAGPTGTAAGHSSHYAFFVNNGYSNAELYATSYPDVFEVSCQDVKLLRQFVIVVFEYTRSPVDVIAASMGVVVCRKAILGGRCVETNEVLGPSITSLIANFITVDGVGFGAQDCKQIVEGVGWNNDHFCDPLVGIRPDSKLMIELNNQTKRYETFGQLVAIYGENDPLNGPLCERRLCTELKNSTMSFVLSLTPYHGWLSYSSLTMILQNSILNSNREESIKIAQQWGFKVKYEDNDLQTS
ncbi:hypothetical protein M3Y95_01245100 [Aphelenchoides besseyi]|nr:hypothetical protein M3Y95_01245100 [Aphelenchoides besseyi]